MCFVHKREKHIKAIRWAGKFVIMAQSGGNCRNQHVSIWGNYNYFVKGISLLVLLMIGCFGNCSSSYHI